MSLYSKISEPVMFVNVKDVGQCLSIHHKISEPVMSNVVMPLPVQCKIRFFFNHDDHARSCMAGYVYSHAMQK